MNNENSSLYEYANGQLQALTAAVGRADDHGAGALLADLLGTDSDRRTTCAPPWPSDVSDDHTPVEFSVALDHGRQPTIRVLAEALAAQPGLGANMDAARRLLATWARRYRLSLDRYHQVADLFLSAPPVSQFALWFSLVFKAAQQPAIKVYFDPNCRGREHAADRVAESLNRLNLGHAYPTLRRYAMRPDAAEGDLDRYTFFALDLHDGPRSRVKVYVSHHDATAADAARAAAAAPGVDADEVAEFCRLAGGDATVFGGRPLVSSYTFVEGDSDRPSGYSLYVPIRSYVTDDVEARDRVLALADRYGHDTGLIDRAIDAVARRDLADGVGLLAHVSLRLGDGRPGLTVYLSSEAYRVEPPRRRDELARHLVLQH
ncbi:prenyltransferase [Actinocatenispora thailandica]|uniref:Prenyltransferase n=1 Tax=Actinocatenispora thailandica TaxID=227318 RepID=A0A7R7DWR1_9ACTN|nr:tryptophan dimethylallyltransferase family protein [Actinocatenispora thailandica]BCJ39314.1 prenyltransferase [Actinocatenispora thailandica]